MAKQKTKKQTVFDEQMARLIDERQEHLEELTSIEKQLAKLQAPRPVESLKGMCLYDEYHHQHGCVLEVRSPSSIRVLWIGDDDPSITFGSVSLYEICEHPTIDTKEFIELLEQALEKINRMIQK